MTDICINPTADPFIRRLQCLTLAHTYDPGASLAALYRIADAIYLWATATSHTETTDPPTATC